MYVSDKKSKMSVCMRALLNHGIKYWTASLEKCKSPVNVSLIFQSLNNERDTTIAQDAVHEVLPPQDVFGQSRTIGISESSTIHSGQQPGLKTYEK